MKTGSLKNQCLIIKRKTELPNNPTITILRCSFNSLVISGVKQSQPVSACESCLSKALMVCLSAKKRYASNTIEAMMSAFPKNVMNPIERVYIKQQHSCLDVVI